ncbi:threonine/serine dehydratase [Virgibacillus sp. LDC-1]|uniref:threonine ammonia-lyase n=1 Tax=Virgibacillus sp. LDC-1 TaxID=3039856 RepID=UPI0024DE08CB|nr:threonine/serine dehydratase [Virgibacillus sp. LDC-1]
MGNLGDIHKARERIQPFIHQTPILHSSQLSKRCQNNIFLKAEHLQKTGSFKIRGAANKVMQEVAKGTTYVTAASSGNHGQAVAYVAQTLGIPSTIVVPEDANVSKVKAIQSYHGNIVACGLTSAERIPKAKELAIEKQGVYIPPYDDPLIIFGQGTVGLEIIEQVKDADIVVVPVGGGGLIAGILTAIKETNPSIQVIGVEPEAANDTYLSLKNGHITQISPTSTIADGLRTSQPGDLTFPILQNYLDDLVLVSEEEIKQALLFVMERMKQLIEPSSATTVAACLSEKLQVLNKRIVCVISGGNVDVHTIEPMLAGL